MLSLTIGVILVVFTVFSLVPVHLHGLGWGPDVVLFLRGSLPIFAAFIGLIAVFIGIADIRDKRENKTDETVKTDSKKE